TITYQDSKAGTCPTVVSRKFTVTDTCGNIKECTQTINVDDTTLPTLTCPANRDVEGCNTSAITGCAYSETSVTITLTQLQAEGGNASDNCAIDTIRYRDSKEGT